jgi:hypothetical protein
LLFVARRETQSRNAREIAKRETEPTTNPWLRGRHEFA